jgi:DNA-binding XRE family transcriptional regulator
MKIMSHATMSMDGKNFILVPQQEYERLMERTEVPSLPVADKNGSVDALAYMRASMGRKLIARRQAAGLTQKALATAAGVRIETLNRVEKARVTPDTATIVKIDKALRRAESRLKKSAIKQ